MLWDGKEEGLPVWWHFRSDLKRRSCGYQRNNWSDSRKSDVQRSWDRCVVITTEDQQGGHHGFCTLSKGVIGNEVTGWRREPDYAVFCSPWSNISSIFTLSEMGSHQQVWSDMLDTHLRMIILTTMLRNFGWQGWNKNLVQAKGDAGRGQDGSRKLWMVVGFWMPCECGAVRSCWWIGCGEWKEREVQGGLESSSLSPESYCKDKVAVYWNEKAVGRAELRKEKQWRPYWFSY